MWPTGNANDLRATAVDVEPTDRRTIKGKTALGLPLDPVSRRYPRRTWQSEAEWLALGNAQLTSLLKLPEDPMSRTFALVLTVLGSLWLPGKPLPSSPHRPDRPGPALRPSAACRMVPPIRGALRTPAASAMPRACRPSAATPRSPWSPRHRRHRYDQSRRRPIRADHGPASAPMPSSQEARRRPTGAAARRSAPSPAFAGAVRPMD